MLALSRPFDLRPLWPYVNWTLFGVALAYLLLGLAGMDFGGDTHAYWQAGHLDNPYSGAVVRGGDAFLYSPAFAQAWWPLSLVPYPVAAAMWFALLVGCLVYLRLPGALILVPVMWDVWVGNVFVLTATLIVVGFRYPVAWAFPLLTKVTPGVGLLWFAVRREWRSLGMALGATTAVVAVSALLAPDLWAQWFDVLRGNTGNSVAGIPIPLVLRLPVAAGIVVWGARTDRQWTVIVGAMLAMPVLWTSALAMLVAIPRVLHRLEPHRDRPPQVVVGGHDERVGQWHG